MLTPKQEAFCKAIVLDGMNYTDAYRKAYNAEKMSDKTVNEKASRLKDEDKVWARICELRKETDSPKIMSAMQRKEKLTTLAENSEDPRVIMQAIDLLNKMTGEYVTKVEANVDTDVHINIELSDD